MAKFNVLISGCGTAGAHVARIAAADDRCRVTGLYDPNPSAVETLQTEFPEASAFPELIKALDAVRPDIVVIAGPDHLHAEQSLAAIQRRCHVLIEKPLATSLADARLIMEAAAKAGITAMTDQTMRYVYPYRQISGLARDGEIGEIFYLQGDYVHDMWSYYSREGHDYTPWRSDPKHPQNILLGGGCHPVDLILWTVDSPALEVMCYSNKLSIPEFPSDDCYLLSIKFQNNAIGKVHVSSGCSGHAMGDFLEVYGTTGTLSKGLIMRRGAEPIEIPRPKEETVIGGHGWGGSVSDFIDTVDGKIENPITLDQGAKTVAVCEAALESAKLSRPVTIPSVIF